MAATTSPYLSFGMFGFVGDCCRWICNCRVDGRVGVAAWGEARIGFVETMDLSGSLCLWILGDC
jgi:hypothetical protein